MRLHSVFRRQDGTRLGAGTLGDRALSGRTVNSALSAACACEVASLARNVRIVIYPDDEHPCPVCGADWKVPHVWPRRPGRQSPRRDRSRWFVPEDSGWCSDPECRISDEQRDEYRVFRRIMGWDPTEESVTRPSE